MQARMRSVAALLAVCVSALGVAALAGAPEAPPAKPSEAASKPPQVQLELDLTDGSHVIGEPVADGLDISTPYGSKHFKWPALCLIEWKAGRPGAHLELTNGDKVAGSTPLEKIELKSLVGPMAIPIGMVRRMMVRANGGGVPFSLRFDGKQNYVEVPKDPALDPLEAMTLEFWFKTTSAAASAIVGKRSWPEVSDHGYQIHIDNGILYAYWEGAGQQGTRPVNDGQWHHVAITWNGRVRCLIQDGVRIAHGAPGPWTPSEGTFRIGGIDGKHPNDFFEGSISQVRLSKVDRYSDRYFAKPDVRLVADADTVALWDFTDGAGEVVRDRSGHGHDGKLIGNPLPEWNRDLPLSPFILDVEYEHIAPHDEF
jgi:hypothetical protein